jgi:hypothetical protein
MKLEMTLDSRKWNQQVAALASALGKDGPVILRDETRLFIKQAARFTPPKNRKQGQDAVQRDVKRAAQPLEREFFTADWIRALVDKYQGQWDKIEAALKKTAFGKWRFEKFSKRLHTGARDSRGRVNRSQRTFAFPTQEILAYVKRVKAHVGLLKSGWWPAYRQLGGKMPSWITRHTRAPGRIVDLSANPNIATITVENHGRGIGQTRHFVQGALNSRAVSIARRIRLILSGYSKEVAAGMRPRRKATPTGTSFNAS